MQIPILSGIYTDSAGDFRTKYPLNMIPVPKQQGVSNGYLRPGEGIVADGVGPGITRGGINWNGQCFRVMGTKLVLVDESGAVTTLGEVGGTEPVSFDYSIDRLAIASNGNLFYWNNTDGLTQVTDPDLGVVNDVCWIDGYFMTTDGEFLVITDLSDPTAVNPLKYGSSEVDPDPIVGIHKIRNEVHAINRYTIEVFDNIGGQNFPFQRIDGAQITRGAMGTHCLCTYLDAMAFLGGGRNESPAIWLGAAGSSSKLSSREIDQLLENYTESQLSDVVIESRNVANHDFLYVHLPDRTMVYDNSTSQVIGQPVWFELSSPGGEYRAKYFIWAYGKWLLGDTQSSNIGHFDESISTHWDEHVDWEFSTQVVYNNSTGAIFHALELVCLTGRIAEGGSPQIFTQYSNDGINWSEQKFISVGKAGDLSKRLQWLQQGLMRNWRIQRFGGTSESHLTTARLEARIEGLVY